MFISLWDLVNVSTLEEDQDLGLDECGDICGKSARNHFLYRNIKRIHSVPTLCNVSICI